MSDEALWAFNILRNSIKMRIVEILGPDKKLSFKEIMDELGDTVYSSLLSNHLKKLREDGVVEQDERGKYFLTQRGLLLYKILLNSKYILLGGTRVRVLHENLYSEDMSSYLTRILSEVASASMPHSKRQRLVSKLIEKFSSMEESVILKDRLLLHLIAEVEDKGWLSEQFSYSIWIGKKHGFDSFVERERIIQRYTVSLLEKGGLLNVFSQNMFFFKMFPRGFLLVHLIDPSVEDVKRVSRESEKISELVLEYSSPPSNLLEIVEFLEKSVPLTVVLNREGALESIRNKVPRDSFHNTLFVVKTRRPLSSDQAMLYTITPLINKGFSVIITSSNTFPSLLNYAIKSGEEEVLHASFSVLLPSLYLRQHLYGMKPDEYVNQVLGDLEKNVLRSRLAKTKHLLGALRLKSPVEAVQLSYVGVEAMYISSMEVYIDLLNDKRSRLYTCRILLEKILDIWRELTRDISDVQVRRVFFAPLHPFNRASAVLNTPTRIPLHVHVNMFSPVSFNTGDLEFYAEKEGKIQSLFPGESLSAAEIKLSQKTSVYEVTTAAKMLEEAGVKTYTFSLGKLKTCLTCGYTSSHLSDVCTRCYSRRLAAMIRPLPRYLEETSPLVDKYMREEYRMRPPFIPKKEDVNLNPATR